MEEDYTRVSAYSLVLTGRFPIWIHDDFSAAARFHECECFGELFQGKPVSNHFREVHFSSLQHLRGLVPRTPQSTPEDPSDVCVFENDPVRHIELYVLRGQPE